jgi:hypothetical protein
MAGSEAFYDEFISRSNRTLGAYLSMIAWVRKLDCVIVVRDDIMEYWGLSSRIEDKRINKLKVDIAKYFPFVNSLITTGSRKRASIYMSRIQLPNEMMKIPLADMERAKILNENGIKTGAIKLISEAEALQKLISAIHGLEVDFAD